jgi:radical SAM superfamily enzyme YgiQ (UPF0313 family)
MLYMATLALAKGHPVKIIDLASKPEENLLQLIPPGFAVYGFSTYSVSYGLTRTLASLIQQREPNAIIIAGGPHATALPEQVAADAFDVVVVGEGELALLEILDGVAQGLPLPPVLYGKRPDPLDRLPFPNYDLIDINSYSRQVDGHRCVSILSSRGCPYPCSFCNSNIMGAGKAIRFRAPENVIAEIRAIKARYNIRHFRFQDDIFTINIGRIRQLVPLLAKEEIVFRCFARINNFSEEMARLLRAGGCVHASFGVESGSPKLLGKHAMNKRQTPAQIRAALNIAQQAGIRTRIFLMVGFPGETEDTIEETVALMKSCPWDEFSVYPLIAYPGTPLHTQPERFGIEHIDDDYGSYLQIGRNLKAGFTVRTSTFDERKVQEWRDYMIKSLLADGRIWAGNATGFK